MDSKQKMSQKRKRELEAYEIAKMQAEKKQKSEKTRIEVESTLLPKKTTTTNEIIRNCHTILNALGTNNKVNLNWIPGPEEYEGNERADYLAKLGSHKDPINPIYNKIPFRIKGGFSVF